MRGKKYHCDCAAFSRACRFEYFFSKSEQSSSLPSPAPGLGFSDRFQKYLIFKQMESAPGERHGWCWTCSISSAAGALLNPHS
jgi:hypothetical protein